MMDEDHGREQTTKGIWMARNNDNNILVFDIEGTDSKERGE
jgi:protein SEY1